MQGQRIGIAVFGEGFGGVIKLLLLVWSEFGDEILCGFGVRGGRAGGGLGSTYAGERKYCKDDREDEVGTVHFSSLMYRID
jgi:hypothetical protein